MAVQVDPIKPGLKALGDKRLKLKYDELLSNFAFKFNLRRFTREKVFNGRGFLVAVVRRCKLTLSKPRRKRLYRRA